MATAIVVGVILGFLALLGLTTGGAAREGSYRRGVGWYLDTETPRDTLMRGRVAIPGPRRTSRWAIRLWAVAGVGFLAIAIVAWTIVDSVGAGVVCLVVGLLALALAWDGARQNRRMNKDRGESS